MVYPLVEQHPITDGIEAFAVYDEFFQQEIDPLFATAYGGHGSGRAYPSVRANRRAGAKWRILLWAMRHKFGEPFLSAPNPPNNQLAIVCLK